MELSMLLGTLLLLFTCQLFMVCRGRAPRQLLWRCLSLWHTGPAEAKGGKLGPLARRHFQRRRGEALRGAFRAVELANCVAIAWVASNAAAMGDTGGTSAADGARDYALRPLLTCVVLCALAGVYTSYDDVSKVPRWAACQQRFFPASLRVPDGFDVAYGLAMAAAIYHDTAESCVGSRLTPTLSVLRLALAVLNRSPGQCAAWNLLYYACLVSSQASSAPLPRGETAPCVQLSFDGLWPSVVEYVVIVATTFVMQELSKQEALSVTQVDSWRRECQAKGKVLEATCDATVRLNSELNVLGPSPGLSSWLACSSSVEGLTFQSLFSHDKSRVLQALETSQPLDAEAGKLQAIMKHETDSAVTVPVLILHAAYVDADGATGHIIGLQQDFDHETTATWQARQEQAAAATAQLPWRDRSIGLHQFGGRSSSCGSFTTSRGMSSDMSSRGGSETGDMPMFLEPSSTGSTGQPTSRASTSRASASRAFSKEEARCSCRPLSVVGAKRRRRRQTTLLLHPDKTETDGLAKQLSLVELMKSWNIKVRASDCCHLHATLRDINSVMQEMGACFNLTSQDLARLGPQCRACGILNGTPVEGEQYCTVCLGCLSGASESL